MTTAAEGYAAAYDAALAADRFQDHRRPGDHWADAAELFRLDPLRPLDGNLAVIAGYLRPDDRLVDVGGGAGRVSLALANRVREVSLVEPSPAMRAQFVAARDAAGIANARVTADWWLDSTETGDVVHLADVTYFVRDIAPFVAKLHDSAARRVMITVWSPTPGDLDAELRRIVLGETPPRWPGLPELAAVLWEMGLLPDIRPLPEPPWWIPETAGGLTDQQAVDFGHGAVGCVGRCYPPCSGGEPGPPVRADCGGVDSPLAPAGAGSADYLGNGRLKSWPGLIAGRPVYPGRPAPPRFRRRFCCGRLRRPASYPVSCHLYGELRLVRRPGGRHHPVVRRWLAPALQQLL